MTYEEAIERIKKLHCWGIGNECAYHFDKRGKCYSCEIRWAIESMEKQIPKRIVDGNFCPRCNIGFGIHYPEWCGRCGQRIDYNMEKE